MATETHSEPMSNTADLIAFNSNMAQGLEYPEAGYGHKFPLPDIGMIPRTDHLKRRYDPVVDQMTKSLMIHGKLSVAQKVCIICNHHILPPTPSSSHRRSLP